MLLVFKQSWALLFGILLLMLGNGLQGTLLGVRGALEDIDPSMMGVVMAGYFLGFLGGSKLTPILLQQVGHVRVFAALGSLVSAAFILYAVWINPYAWWMLRVLVGFCFSGLYVVAESWLNHSSTNETRGKTLSVYMMVQMAGMVLGQLMLNVSSPAGYDLFIMLTVLVSLAITPILLTVSKNAPIENSARPMRLKELISISPLACFGMLMLGGIFSAVFAMAPVYAIQRGLSVAQTSLYTTSFFLGALLFQFPIGWLSDRMDRRLLIISLTALGALAGIVSLYIANDIRLLMASAVIIGGASNPLYSLLVAYANDYLELDQMAAAAGGLLFINGLGAMTGPIVIGYAMSHLGPEWFYNTIIILMSTVCFYGIYRMSQREHIVADESAPYLPISARTTRLAAGYAIAAAEEEYLDELEESEETFEERSYDDEVMDRLDKRSEDESSEPGN